MQQQRQQLGIAVGSISAGSWMFLSSLMPGGAGQLLLNSSSTAASAGEVCVHSGQHIGQGGCAGVGDVDG